MQKLNSWSPLLFLAALGAGGMSVAFLMMLMFWIPHPNRSMPAYEDLAAHAAKGGIGVRRFCHHRLLANHPLPFNVL